MARVDAVDVAFARLGQDAVRAHLADDAGDGLAQIEVVLEATVGQAQEPKVGDTHLRRGVGLFRLAE